MFYILSKTGKSPGTRGSVGDRAAGASPDMGKYPAILPATDATGFYTRSIGRGSPFAYAPLFFTYIEMHPAGFSVTDSPV